MIGAITFPNAKSSGNLNDLMASSDLGEMLIDLNLSISITLLRRLKKDFPKLAKLRIKVR